MNEIEKSVIFFNKNKSKDLYREILNVIEPKHKLCKDCNDIIYYSNVIFRISRQKEIKIEKRSHHLYKTLFDEKYYLSVCEECLKKKFPNSIKDKLFNTLNIITIYVFDIPENISNEWKKQNSRTLENFIRKYGEEIGKLKWKHYCDKQSETNTFEYKKAKYNWTEEDFEKYNKSRAVTLDNLIKKHGEDIGLKMWLSYVEKQILTKSAEYYINKYGDEKWKELNKSKLQNLENFIKRYGEEKGEDEFR